MLRIVILGLLAITLSACGPEQSSLDRTADELRDRNEKASAEQERAAGLYKGKIAGRAVYYLRIEVVPTYIASGSRMELLEVPALKGFLSPTDENLAAYNFDEGSYDEDTNTLKLYDGNAPGRYIFNFLKAKIVGNKLVGVYLNGINTPGEQIEFEKVEE